jgi:prefoldin subunit 5
MGIIGNMLIKVSDYIKKLDNLKVPHRGRVIFNEDPNKLGRIKCQVKGIFEATNTDILPWCYSQSMGAGLKPDSMRFMVPELQSEVTITFPYGTVYHPVYTSGNISELTKTPGIFEEDYPNTEGWVNSIPSFFRMNKTQKTLDFYNGGNEFCVRVDGDGNVYLNIPKSLVINVGEDFVVKVGGNHALKTAMNCVYDVGAIHEIKAISQGIVATSISHEGFCLHATGLQFGQVAAQISSMEAKIAILEAKLSEFNSLASEVSSASNLNKPNIAKID